MSRDKQCIGDMEIVWTTIHGDLPGLYQQVRKALSDLPGENKNSRVAPDNSATE